MVNTGQRPQLNGREIEAVLVDAGGVLLGPNWEVVAEILADHAVRASAEDLSAAEPLAMRELDDAEIIRATTDIARRERFLARVLRHAGVAADPATVDAASDEMEEIHLSRGIWEVIHPGAPEALDQIRAAGLRLSLASNAEPLLRSKLESLGLARRFDHLAISGEVGVEKPDRRFFEGALDALGVAAERAVHVGDLYEIDVVGARDAGLEAILVDVADLSADRDVARVHSLADVPALLGLD